MDVLAGIALALVSLALARWIVRSKGRGGARLGWPSLLPLGTPAGAVTAKVP